MQFEIEFEGRRFPFRSHSADDAITRRMHKYRTFYEWDLLVYSRWLLRALGEDGLVVDIGANLGNHALFWSACTHRTVVAIEPNPAILPLLRENLRRNVDPARFYVVAGGAGAESALARLRLASHAPDQWGLAGVEIDPRLSRHDPGVFEVQPLPEWLRRLGLSATRVRLLKIDVEGQETAVLDGAAPILERDHPEILAEAATLPARRALDAALAPFGYRRILRFCSTPTWHFSTIRARRDVGWLRRVGTAARVRWRWCKLKHSLRSRLRRAA